MDQAKDGVVYVSLGTTMPITILPNKTLQAIYSSFAKLAPIKVLLKASNEEILPPGLPKNVKTLAWIPQIPVLSRVLFLFALFAVICAKKINYKII